MLAQMYEKVGNSEGETPGEKPLPVPLYTLQNSNTLACYGTWVSDVAAGDWSENFWRSGCNWENNGKLHFTVNKCEGAGCIPDQRRIQWRVLENTAMKLSEKSVIFLNTSTWLSVAPSYVQVVRMWCFGVCGCFARYIFWIHFLLLLHCCDYGMTL